MKYILTLLTLMGSFLSSSAQYVVYEDNFDSYILNNTLAYQSPNWETWSDPNGGNAEDAKIIEIESSSSPYSVLFFEGIDIVHQLGTKTQGRYQISFNIFIRGGAYFNLEHDFKNVYAFDMWFNDKNDIWYNNSTDSLKLGKYTPYVWHNIMLDIDLGKDSITIFYDSTQLGQFTFSHSRSGESPSVNLDVIDFYGVPRTALEYNIDRVNFLIDDFKYIEVWPLNVEETVFSNISIYPNPTTGSVKMDLSSFNNDVSVIVRDITGKVVSKIQSNTTKDISFNIDGPSGLYFVEVVSKGYQTKVFKVVKK